MIATEALFLLAFFEGGRKSPPLRHNQNFLWVGTSRTSDLDSEMCSPLWGEKMLKKTSRRRARCSVISGPRSGGVRGERRLESRSVHGQMVNHHCIRKCKYNESRS
jgi:hypothetical protein